MLQSLLACFDSATHRIQHDISLSRETVRILLHSSCKVPDVHMMTGVSPRTISRERNRDGGGLIPVAIDNETDSGEVRSRRLRLTGTIDQRIMPKRNINEKQLHQILDVYLRMDDPYLTDLLALATTHNLSLSALLELIIEHVGPDRYALRKCINCGPHAPLVLSSHSGMRLCKTHQQANHGKSLSIYAPTT